MALTISKLTTIELWDYRVDSTYDTAQTIDATTTPITITCTNFPAGVFATNEDIMVNTERFFVTAVDDVANTITCTRYAGYLVTHATAQNIWLTGVSGAYGATRPRAGDSFFNQTRAGTGLILDNTASGFGSEDFINKIKFVIISGTFQRGDAMLTSQDNTFYMGGMTVVDTSKDTIMATGTMTETDSTSDVPTLDISQTTFTLATFANIPTASFIKVDSEYMYVKDSAAAFIVKRGVLGSTAATHESGTAINIISTDLLEQILDADVSGAWGHSTTSNGRIQMDCNILLGSPDQAAISVLASSVENLDFTATDTNLLLTSGSPDYRTHIAFGKGYMDAGTGVYTGLSCLGSIFTGPRDPAAILSNSYSFGNFPNSTIYCHNSQINAVWYAKGACEMRNNSITSFNVNQFFQTTGEESKMYNSYLNHCVGNFASSVIDMSKFFVYSYGNAAGNDGYWVYSLGDATIKECELDANNSYDYIDGFIASGYKDFIDSKVALGHPTYWDGEIFRHYKTFNCKVLDEWGNPVSGAQVKCNYRIEATTNVFTVTTDSNGDIAEQQFLFTTYTSNGDATGDETPTNHIEYFITKSGYKLLRGRFTIALRDDPIKIRKVLKVHRFIEEKSLP